jgi:hypothetical protein
MNGSYKHVARMALKKFAACVIVPAETAAEPDALLPFLLGPAFKGELLP